MITTAEVVNGTEYWLSAIYDSNGEIRKEGSKYFFGVNSMWFTSNNKCGLTNTNSKGYVRKVSITLDATVRTTASGVDLYGSHTPFGDLSTLNLGSISGDRLGSISTEELTFDVQGDYEYFAIVPTESNYFFIESFSITWELPTYTREGFSAGAAGTLCLPFAATQEAIAEAGLEVYELTGKTVENSQVTGIVLTQVEAMDAGKPYIFYTKSSEATSFSLDLSGNAVDAPTAVNGLHGTFVDFPFESTYEPGKYYIITRDGNNDVIQAASSSSGVRANRAYIILSEVPEINPSSSPASNRLVIPTTDFLAGIAAIPLSTTSGQAYDISGRRTQSAKGLRIVEGRKLMGE